ncbi:MAG: L-rhamnose isomerase [Verrucomicrobiota bacterium JB022]|nr:L-rhamnose isomerase [Verrucomicrobiota bacterium JB022]
MTALYDYARETYAKLGVDTEAALNALAGVAISLHCWQGDDVVGFESSGEELGGGLAVTGNYPGKARTIDELRQDLDVALKLIPGTHRLNLHAIYGDFGGQKVDRDQVEVSHFQSWIDWAAERKMGLDFNPTCFAHPKASDGLTLSHPDAGIRNFWIEHCQRSREIGAAMGRQLGSTTVTNVWIPDGLKDMPASRLSYRARLEESLDAVFAKELPASEHLDAVECKLFGIGSESFVVGSHEFYMGYAIKKQKTLCLDAGHFHPTESIADKVSSVLLSVPHLLLHVSRGVRWDSDHVVLLDDQTQAIMQELVRCNALPKTHIGLDFFDASINRIAAWVIGTRAAQKALLQALLEPAKALVEAEQAGNYTARLALFEQAKTLPWAIVWDEFCRRQSTPVEADWLPQVQDYERKVLNQR